MNDEYVLSCALPALGPDDHCFLYAFVNAVEQDRTVVATLRCVLDLPQLPAELKLFDVFSA